jgi:uncharacterized protein
MPLTKPVPKTQPFEIRQSRIQGFGGYATKPLARGTRIGEYVGERISQREADRRYDDDSMDRHHTFLFTVSSRTTIDAAVGGNDTRFINHSCAPNCEAVIEDSRVFIDALRAIPVGSELFYDYAYEREADAGSADEAKYPCHCGSAQCRGTILAPPPRKRRRRVGRTRSKRGATDRTTAARRPRKKRKTPARGKHSTTRNRRKKSSSQRST